MRVADLIAELQKFDADDEVGALVDDYYYGVELRPVTEVRLAPRLKTVQLVFRG